VIKMISLFTYMQSNCLIYVYLCGVGFYLGSAVTTFVHPNEGNLLVPGSSNDAPS